MSWNRKMVFILQNLIYWKRAFHQLFIQIKEVLHEYKRHY